MSAYYITSLLTAVTSLSLGIFVFYKNPKNPIHRSLLRLNIFVSVWSLFLFFHYISYTEQAALYTLKMLHVAAIFIPASYLNFIINLLGINKKRVVRFTYLISGFFLILNFTPYFISGVGYKLHFRYYATAGILYWPWILAYAYMAGYGIYLMLKNYPYVSSIKKNQIKYVLFASIIGFAGGATIYPLFYNIPIEPFGEHIIFLYPIIFAVAVLKHNLLDLNIVIRHTLAYSVSVILVSIVYIITVLVSERLLRDLVGYQSLWITVTAAVAIAVLFTPIKNRVQSVIDRFYINGAYKRLEKELVESDKRKALANLAAGMAHEIRNPLTAIKTFAEYLPQKFDDMEFRDNFCRIVKGEVDKINSIIAQLLEFAKPSVMKISQADIREILDYTLNLLSGEMIKSNIKLTKSYAPIDLSVRCDSNKLKHAFFNIIKNAIEAMEGGGSLEVATYYEKDGCKIEISDTGPGIDKKDLAKIFDPFYSTKEKGAGLGLAVVHSIITEHKGVISVESAVGTGTKFIIYL